MMPTTVEPKRAEAAISQSGSSVLARNVQSAVIGVFLIIAFWPILVSMYGSWFDEQAYMEHGILVVPAAAYMVWTKWSKLKRIPSNPSAWGLLLMLIGALQ